MNGLASDTSPAFGLDWQAVHLFLAIARAGSLTRAAVSAGLSQPTLGRRLDDLERRLGVVLLIRGRGGVVPTEAGTLLLERAEAMEREAHAFARAAVGRQDEAAGDVRVTASRVVATHLLPPIIAELADSDPAIRIDIVASDEITNLLRRDADVAVRMVRPTQPELIAQQIGALHLGAYASRGYVGRRGLPQPTAEALLAHRLIGYDRSTLILDGLRAAGIAASREMFAARTDDQVVYGRLVATGAGIGFLPRLVAADLGLVEVPLPVAVPPLPVWLAAHRDVRANAAVRRVTDALGDGLKRRLSADDRGEQGHDDPVQHA